MKTLLWILMAGAGVLRASAQNYTVEWRTIDGGGGTSTGGVFAASGTIGQPDAGDPLTGGQFSVDGGFWPGMNPAPTPGAPWLAIERLGDDRVRLIWPRSATGFRLDQTALLSPVPGATVWNEVTAPSATNATHISVTVPSESTRFYRLRKP